MVFDGTGLYCRTIGGCIWRRPRVSLAKNVEVFSGVDQGRFYTGGRDIWTMNRGGDRKKLLETLLDRQQRIVIRSTENV